jgi:hypothetical protein
MNENPMEEKMEKLVVELKGRDLYHDGKLLKRIDQATKGPGNEVFKIEGLPHSNGKKTVSLSILKQGINELECTASTATNRTPKSASSKKEYELTHEEAVEIGVLQGQINDIINVAKARYVAKPDFSKDTSNMTPEEKLAFKAEIEKWMKYMNLA